MSENADYEGRIPYLYTIREDGACPQTLRLYYNDLANPDALITYKIDGVSVTPEGSVLTFPSKGRHILQIEIEEAPERKWEIEYKTECRLTMKKNTFFIYYSSAVELAL